MRKILIVEDEIILSEMYKMEFTHRNFEVFVAQDGEAAMNIARNRRPDFILLDIMLPMVDGIALFKKFLEDSEIRSIPVGFLSALGKDIAEFVGHDKEILSKAAFFMQKEKYTPKEVAEEVEKNIIIKEGTSYK